MDEDEEITEKKLENQEIWTRVYFNGYFYKFIDMCLCVEIVVDPEEKKDGEFAVSNHFVFPPINEENGHIDITGLMHTFLDKLQKHPGRKVRCLVTGFGRQFKINPHLLSTPIPEELLKMFVKTKERQ